MNNNSYYIGYMFNDNNNTKSLKKIQNILSNPKFQLDNFENIDQLHSPLIYLGNMEDTIAHEFINYLNNLFMAVIQKNNQLKCDFTNLDIVKIDENCGLILNYENELLKNKIVPFLKKFGIDPILNTNYLDPVILYVPLVNFTCNNYEETKQLILDSVYSPKNAEFIIDSLNIYKKNNHNELTLVSSYPFSN